jgi:alpha-beta hydrolase superfamily lysophospholipase
MRTPKNHEAVQPPPDSEGLGCGLQHDEPPAVIEGPDWVRVTEFPGVDGMRTRRTGYIRVGSSEPHLLRLSEPDPAYADNSDTPFEALFPGWTEVIEGGISGAWHETVASENPGQYTVSFATDGVSLHGKPLSHGRALGRQFPKMAAERQQIIRHLAGPEAPVILTGTSMGAVLAVFTAHANSQAVAKANIRGLRLLSPGVIAADVPPEEAFRLVPIETTAQRLSVLQHFLGHIGMDAARESVHHPREAAGALAGVIATAATCFMHPEKATAMTGNLLQLLQGTPWQTLTEVAASYKISVLTGEQDPVAEIRQWEALRAKYPDNIRLKVVPGKGHAMSLDTRGMVSQFAAPTLQL